MKAILLLTALIFQCEIFSPSGAKISGSVTEDESKEILPFTNVVLYQNGAQIKGTTTDVNGIYELKEIPEGDYKLSFSFLGYTTKTKDIKVKNEPIIINSSLTKGIYLREVVVEYERPLVICDYTYCEGTTRSRKEIERLWCCFTRIREVKKTEPQELIIGEPKRSELQIFPNPSIGENVTLIYDNRQIESNNEVEVLLIDLLGRLIESQEVKLVNGRVQLKVKELEEVIPGQYFISIIDGNKRLSKKIIIQR